MLHTRKQKAKQICLQCFFPLLEMLHFFFMSFFFQQAKDFDCITMQEYPESQCNSLQVSKLTLNSETEVGWSKKIIVRLIQIEHFTIFNFLRILPMSDKSTESNYSFILYIIMIIF